MAARRNHKRVQADALEISLEFADRGARVEDPLVHVAHALRGADTIREAPRAAAKERMLQAFAAANTPSPAPEVPHTHDSVPSVHTHDVQLPDGAVLHLADIEPISPARAAAIAHRIGGSTPAAVESE